MVAAGTLPDFAAAVRACAARAAETERLGRLPDETVAMLLELGVARMLMPRRWGGLECDLGGVHEMAVTLAHGCMSTAWCAAIFAEHPWVLSRFDARAQEDVWGGGPDVILCLSNNPASAQIEAVADGFRLSGSWRFVSGCDFAAWFMFVADYGPEDAPVRGLFLVPRGEIDIDPDSWQVAGLRGTGSKVVSVRGAFVPAYRVLDMAAANPPGVTADMPPLFHQPVPATLGSALAAVALGGAEAALETFREAMSTRVLHLQRRLQAAEPAAQIELAEATVRVDSARLMLRECAGFARHAGQPGCAPGEADFARLRLHKAYVVRQAVEAVDRLFAASGGGALLETSPLQRIWRDAHAVQAHAGLTWNNHAQNYGSVAAGLGPTNRHMF
jgi:alkylation response protein AidB-like acyl-CoA dehydrogenase